MKILITNIVTLNGGDFAILEAMMHVLKRTYGDETEFVVYDLHADVALKYYPGINFRTLLYEAYRQKGIKGEGLLKKIYNQFSPLKRLKLAAKLYAAGFPKIANTMLGKNEKVDFDHYTSADIIISTGGTYLVENYSLAARVYDYYFTLALQKPLVFFTQSLGPFNKPENKRDIKNIFDKASLILLRDEASYQNLKDINVDVSRARVCADVVFSDTSVTALTAAKFKQTGNPVKVGISVREWKFFKDRSTAEGLEKYFRSVAAICEYIVTALGGEVVFISTCQAIEEYHVDDSLTAKEIYALLSGEAKKGTSVNRDFHTPEQLKYILKDLDVVISTRMHTAIQSLNLGVPVLPIAYEFKTKELFGKLMDKGLILDIDNIEEEMAVEVFRRFLDFLKESREGLFEGVTKEHLSALKPVKYLKEELKFETIN
jgi:colanic acid/amylovoran biosynthesis protein